VFVGDSSGPLQGAVKLKTFQQSRFGFTELTQLQVGAGQVGQGGRQGIAAAQLAENTNALFQVAAALPLPAKAFHSVLKSASASAVASNLISTVVWPRMKMLSPVLLAQVQVRPALALASN